MFELTPSIVTAPDRLRRFADDVRRDLTASPRQLQSKYLYDALGSCLFEAICRLPWYRITRAETALLDRESDAIVAAAGDPLTIIELGCGSGAKLVRLAEALQRAERSAHVHLIDISTEALALSERTLGALEHVSVVGHRATYETGLRQAAAARHGDGPLLVLLLGSNIGNFDPPAAADFLREIRAALRPGDALLVGADLVKPEAELLVAYDDPLGVTAAFNRNLLVRINRELGGDFDLDRWVHRAVWNAGASRIEMHLVARGAQRVRVRLAGLDFAVADGESIWTESSYKYELPGIARLGAEAGFETEQQCVEPGARFSLTRFRAA